METQKIVNLLNSSANEYSKFAKKKMVRHWQWIKRRLLRKWANKAFNQANRIKSLCLLGCIYFGHRKYYSNT